MEKQKAVESAFIGGKIPVPLRDRIRAESNRQGLKLQHILKEALEKWLKGGGK